MSVEYIVKFKINGKQVSSVFSQASGYTFNCGYYECQAKLEGGTSRGWEELADKERRVALKFYADLIIHNTMKPKRAIHMSAKDTQPFFLELLTKTKRFKVTGVATHNSESNRWHKVTYAIAFPYDMAGSKKAKSVAQVLRMYKMYSRITDATVTSRGW